MDRKNTVRSMLILLTAAVLVTACTNGKEENNAVPPPAASEEAPQSETNPPAAETPKGTNNTDQGTDSKKEPAAEVEDLPETKSLEVTVEGESESVPAKLTKSELGYAFYLMEGFEFTPEEPGKDMVFHKDFPEFFLRIEPLPADADVDQLRASSEEALKAVSPDIVDMKEGFFDEIIRDTASFILHASNSDGSVTMIVMPIGDKLFRFTVHFPLTEAAEGVSPRFYPMLNSIVTPAP